MQRIDRKSYATIEFTLDWESDEAKHAERFLARRVNMWRDVFPPGMEEALVGLAPGESASLDYAASEAMSLRDERLVLDVPRFAGATVQGRRIEPRVGRFYPRGLFANLPGVFPQDVRPTRITSLDDDGMRIDLNHPMAGRPFTLSAKVLDVAPAEAEVGGRLCVWTEEICDYGPGMQARLPGLRTDFTGGPPSRLDEDDDALFYAAPRLIGHVDAQASDHLRRAYAAYLALGMRALDLMSSMQSHLPDDLGLRVVGLGLNEEELAANPLLSERLVHDLNHDSALPFADERFDAVVCSLSIEYLTQPHRVLAECVRTLRPGGALLIGVSNRWFPTKARNDWPDLHEFERLGLVLDLMLETPGLGEFSTQSARNWWRPMDDRHIGKTFTSDPVYVAAARKT